VCETLALRVREACFTNRSVGNVTGVVLEGGRSVVVKARPVGDRVIGHCDWREAQVRKWQARQ
jgi:hypothetical protein